MKKSKKGAAPRAVPAHNRQRKPPGRIMEKMIYSISGIVRKKSDERVVLEVGGIGLVLAATPRTLKLLPEEGARTSVFSYLHVKEDALDLYGFSTEEERSFFELLLTVSGVGPKSALAVLEVAELTKLKAAIQESRPDLLTRASGIGKKTAERIVLELKTKISALHSGEAIEAMEGDSDIVEALSGLGYRKEEVREAISKLPLHVKEFDSRLKGALKLLGGKSL